MDEMTVKVMSCSCKMADITDEGISLVEDLNKRRQPLPALEAVYLIEPSHDSARKFMQDMSGKSPLYKKAYVFFSSPINRNLFQFIKGDQSVLSRVGVLREYADEFGVLSQRLTERETSQDPTLVLDLAILVTQKSV